MELCSKTDAAPAAVRKLKVSTILQVLMTFYELGAGRGEEV